MQGHALDLRCIHQLRVAQNRCSSWREKLSRFVHWWLTTRTTRLILKLQSNFHQVCMHTQLFPTLYHYNFWSINENTTVAHTSVGSWGIEHKCSFPSTILSCLLHLLSLHTTIEPSHTDLDCTHTPQKVFRQNTT